MVTQQVKIRKGSYYIRRHFDGTCGVPKCTFFLSMDGIWKNRLDETCFFPSEKLARSFLQLREKYEETISILHEMDYKEFNK